MKRTTSTMCGALLALAILPLSFGIGKAAFGIWETALAGDNDTAKVIFKVRCYDEGKAALRGLKGIEKIETGFHYLNETDTVYFDPKQITVEEMEAALKRAGTYVETIHEKGRN